MSNKYLHQCSPPHPIEGLHETNWCMVVLYMQCHRSSYFQQRMAEEAHSLMVGCRDICEMLYYHVD